MLDRISSLRSRKIQFKKTPFRSRLARKKNKTRKTSKTRIRGKNKRNSNKQSNSER